MQEDRCPDYGSWTPLDESAFQDMQSRRARVLALRDKNLSDALGRCPYQGATAFGPDVIKWMKRNAAAIRDALAPFDDGARDSEALGNCDG